MQDTHSIKALTIDSEGNTPYHIRAAEDNHFIIYHGVAYDIVDEFDLYCGYGIPCNTANNQGLLPHDIIKKNASLSETTKEKLYTLLKLAHLSMKLHVEKLWRSDYLNALFRATVEARYFYVAQRFLTDPRVDVNTRYADSQTPLMKAMLNGDERMVRLLVTIKNTNIVLEDKQGQTTKDKVPLS